MTRVLPAMRFCIILALCAAGTSQAAAQAGTPVTLYTSVETDQLAAFKAAIEKDLPDIEVKWVRKTPPASSPPGCWPNAPARAPT